MPSQVLPLTKTTFMPSASTGEVQAFYRESGEQRWSNKTMLYRGLSAPVVFPGAVAVGDEDGYVHFLSPRTGEEMARVRLSGPIVTRHSLLVQALFSKPVKATLLICRIDKNYGSSHCACWSSECRKVDLV